MAHPTRARPIHIVQKSAGIGAAGALGVAGGLPLQKPLAREEQSAPASGCGIETDENVVSRKNQGEHALAKVARARTATRFQMQERAASS